MLSKRLICRLDIKGSRLIKGYRFEGLRVLGEAYKYAIEYYKLGIDEIFYSDAVASLYGRNSLSDLVKRTKDNINIPITVGGGIRSLEDCTQLLSSGADKLAINTAAIKRPILLTQISEKFGKQCLVLSIQAIRNQSMESGWEAMIESGRERTGIDVLQWINKSIKLGIGEIFLTSIYNDGTLKGPDNDLLKLVKGIYEVPIIYGGGINLISEVEEVFRSYDISAVSIGLSLHKKNILIEECKKSLSEKGFHMRGYISNAIKVKSSSKMDVVCCIINYGMGNIHSLYVAIREIGYECIVSQIPDEIEGADVIFLPGVGAFKEGIKNLKDLNLDSLIYNLISKGKIIIGICLGMQLLYENGTEGGECKGLGIFKGSVENLSNYRAICDSNHLKLPHVGWNKIKTENNRDLSLIKSLDDADYYFVHSYGVICDPNYLIASSNYEDSKFASIVRRDNVIGIQFHPELSGYEGLELINNIISIMLHRQ